MCVCVSHFAVHLNLIQYLKQLYFNQKKIISSFCNAQGTLLKVVGAWMGGEFEGEWIHMTESPLLSTWNYHYIVNWLYTNMKLKAKKERERLLQKKAAGRESSFSKHPLWAKSPPPSEMGSQNPIFHKHLMNTPSVSGWSFSQHSCKLLFPFERWRDWESERLRDFPRVAQLENDSKVCAHLILPLLSQSWP